MKTSAVILYKPEEILFLEEYKSSIEVYLSRILEKIDKETNCLQPSIITYYIYTVQNKFFMDKISDCKSHNEWTIISIEELNAIIQGQSYLESLNIYFYKNNEETNTFVRNKYNQNWSIKTINIINNEILLDNPFWLQDLNDDTPKENVYITKDGSKLYIENSELDLINSMLSIRKPIFVIGERGSGKTTIIQKYIKEKLNLSNEKFVSVACGTLDPATAQAEIFGYVPGAFTGAEKETEGFVGKANKGCLYLDEVQDLNKDVQRQLIKCIDEHVFYKKGSRKEEVSDFLLICSSNKTLKEIKLLMFEDFFDRISTFQIKIKSIEEQKIKAENFIANSLKSVWDNYKNKTPNNRKFYSYENLDEWNLPSEKTIKEKIISALNETTLNGNFRDIEKLLAYIELYALNEAQFKTFGNAAAINKNIEIAIDKWKEFINERDSENFNPIIDNKESSEAKNALNKKESELHIFTDDDIKKLSWRELNNKFKEEIARRAVELYNSPTAAARKLGVDKNSIIRIIKRDLS